MNTPYQTRPLCIDLFAGLFGWGEAFALEGYRVIGFDIENQFANFGKQIPNHCELVLRDVRSISGADLVKEFGAPECIVASPPCQFFSYVAMPWSKAKALGEKVATDPAERAKATDLFNQCFRIQREVSEAAGRYVPIVIENVRGAQRWVGKARWNFGSFYLWGDVPALMPIPAKRPIKQKGSMTPGKERWCRDGIAPLETGHKSQGLNWSDQTKRGQDYAGLKKRDEGYDYDHRTFGWKAPLTSSASKKRKQASAEIAKIPPALAHWIARCFTPKSAVLK